MTYSMYLCLAMATAGTDELTQPEPADAALDDVLRPLLLRLRQRILDFLGTPAAPQAVFKFERELQVELR